MDPTIDVNVYLSRWPFRRLRGDETPELVERLRARGVQQAWVGSFDALLHRDLGEVNRRLAADCRTHAPNWLVPFGAVNPRLPDWEEELRRCHEVHGMPGIRLHPNYHDYRLDDPACERLLELAAERQLLVQIARTMEDERTQHPLVRVPHVDVQPLANHLRRLPGLRVMLLNAFRGLRPDLLTDLAGSGRVWVEIAMLEGVGGVGNLLRQLSPERVLFGSYFPFFPWESAQLKLREAGLSGSVLQAVLVDNAQRLRAPRN